MTSSKPPCVTCDNKGVGIFRCEGCLQVYCRKHLNEHRDSLSHQLDEIVLEHDILQQTITDATNTQDKEHPVLKQIDQWEKDTTQKIQRVAEELRRQVNQLTDTQKVSKQLHELAERLQIARIDDDYVETDLNSWKTMLQKLNNDLNSFSPTVNIHENPSKLLVADVFLSISPYGEKRTERFSESSGNVHIDENGLIARHCGLKNGNAYVCGSSEYSSGIHKIRFMVQKSSKRYIASFYVASKSMALCDTMNRSWYQSYGWNSDDSINSTDTSGTLNNRTQDMNGETSFEIELQLDCDNREISYINQRTKNRKELKVELSKCPFPWQIRFYLYTPGDCVYLLP